MVPAPAAVGRPAAATLDRATVDRTGHDSHDAATPAPARPRDSTAATAAPRPGGVAAPRCGVSRRRPMSAVSLPAARIGRAGRRRPRPGAALTNPNARPGPTVTVVVTATGSERKHWRRRRPSGRRRRRRPIESVRITIGRLEVRAPAPAASPSTGSADGNHVPAPPAAALDRDGRGTARTAAVALAGRLPARAAGAAVSNALALAAVTRTMQAVVQEAAAGAVSGARVLTRRPDKGGDAGQEDAVVSLFLLAVSPNESWRNEEVPTRASAPRPRPPLPPVVPR